MEPGVHLITWGERTRIMSRVTVRQGRSSTEPTANLLKKLDEILQNVRQRAFGLFESKGGVPGGELEDWVQAEQELLLVPPSSVSETTGAYDLQIPSTSLFAHDVEVLVRLNQIAVIGQKVKCSSGKQEKDRCSACARTESRVV